MNALLVYESMFGSTEAIARAIAAGLAPHMQTDVVEVADALLAISAETDVLIVGGPTHTFSMSRMQTRNDAVTRGGHAPRDGIGIREWLDQLDVTSATHLRAATFDTRVSSMKRWPGSAAKSAVKVLGRKRVAVVAKPISFYVKDVTGPLASGELARAHHWGDQLGQSLSTTKEKS
ncbi:MAG: flavodoxin [Nocardioidaceae bacterium]|nr:flavodoxin [Nocardioidaceae bacterium]